MKSVLRTLLIMFSVWAFVIGAFVISILAYKYLPKDHAQAIGILSLMALIVIPIIKLIAYLDNKY